MFGLKETAARRRLRKLVDSGKASQTVKHTRDSQNRPVTITAYRLVKKEQA